ncbi:SpoIIE family protein phosphatase [Geodermatophilus sp. YIM 151500]|uniref:SpoIIE family protein phosphatase n=1 Tax=Geodermatophilus sp. YIM 151500 TaxID=2984531 RepID=UPI0021E3E24F|nr:SpoIIE family protein phosphatase [Geodermatophilus sp. YIM 151500]MCV2490028.1 SpoIIE family protein phosphatase [Geodermatophilus sp. YIM 151500]
MPALPVPRAADPLEVLEGMPAAFFQVDARWRFTYVNEVAERLMRRTRAQLLGRCLWASFPEAVGTVFEAAYRSASASGEPVVFEAASPGPDDGWYDVQAWPCAGGLAVAFRESTDRHRTDERLRRGAARTAFLDRLAGELAAEHDGAAALARLARLVVPELTDGCIVTVVDRDGRPRDVSSWHTDPGRRELLERYTEVRLDTLPPESPVGRALREGTPAAAAVDDVLALMPCGTAAELLRALGSASVVVLPLRAGARTIGVLTLYQDPDRPATADALLTAHEVAARAGLAVDRLHRQHQQAQLAEGLQRSLLTDPPDLPGLSVAVRYVPATEAARVGGDWYDAFLQRDGTPVVVIGDVVGHDIAAAAAMGQLRGLLRGIAHYSGAGPVEVLRGLDEAVTSMHADTLATAAVARFEPAGAGRTRLRWANAGHPPPVLVGRDGRVTVLGGRSGDLLLGVDPAAGRRERVRLLRPGDTVLLHTDGLIERRDATIDAGTAQLVAELRVLAGRPPEELCEALVARMLQGTPQDDAALVTVRIGRPPA